MREASTKLKIKGINQFTNCQASSTATLIYFYQIFKDDQIEFYHIRQRQKDDCKNFQIKIKNYIELL